MRPAKNHFRIALLGVVLLAACGEDALPVNSTDLGQDVATDGIVENDGSEDTDVADTSADTQPDSETDVENPSDVDPDIADDVQLDSTDVEEQDTELPDAFDAVDTADAPDTAELQPLSTVELASGTFMMGSPETDTERFPDELEHEVTVSSFHMMPHEVTQAEWMAVDGTNPSFFADCGANCPVEQVNWYAALAFANWRSAQEGYEPCYDFGECVQDPAEWTDGEWWCEPFVATTACTGYRLPTEAEWEFAARAGSLEPRYGTLEDIGWAGTSAGEQTHPAGAKQPNAHGLYDMLGNVWEWCQDWHGVYRTDAQTDPTGMVDGFYRVFRGGSWYSSPAFARVSARGQDIPDYRFSDLGFRLVRSGAARLER